MGKPVREIIFGGTFDPIHLGHLVAAEQAIRGHKFKRVVFVPAGSPWMKNSNITSSFHRLNMIKLAISSNPTFVVSEVDIQRDGPTYMIDTLFEFQKDNRDDKPCVLIGSLFSDLLPLIKRRTRGRNKCRESLVKPLFFLKNTTPCLPKI